ncbi:MULTISPECIES: exonuclease domain-containing protein [Nocardioides]|uniref:Histone-like nucleoid-structuring protein Lsr2 n=1 Tax=Nocardioides vastitatis TaxID=2568655 RepID=A0ABW0ZM39_9ACTN|nr:histone-like nucleoid-structuring protein Lsr2 [Nocardioides sp.]
MIDVETTGLSPNQHRVLEVAVVTTDPWGRVVDEWATRINPQGPVGATHIHGIRDADVAHAPTFSEVVVELNDRLRGAAIAAHHARFDLSFLRAEYRRAGWDLPFVPALCTLEASEYHLPSLDRRRLTDCCWAVGAPLTSAHSALGDARATAGLLAMFMHPHIGRAPLREHVELPGSAMAISWPTAPSRAPSVFIPERNRVSPRAQTVMARQAAAPVPQALVEIIERFSLVDALDEGAPSGALAYLEKLAEVLEDGEVTTEEADELAAIAEAVQLTDDDVAAANRAFVLTLAHAALDDGKVSRAERAELQQIADLLGVNQKVIPALLDRAENARNQRLSTFLKELPTDWPHGTPLRVGDKVVFTGCEDTLRARLEWESERLGVRIIGAVSAKTAMLVTDGTFEGTKAEKARESGTRTVQPATYAVLLAHLQPALARSSKPVPTTPKAPTPQHAEGVTGDSLTRPRSSPSTTGPTPADVRAWARASGYEVGTRGRLHQELIDAYEKATGHQVVPIDDRGRNAFNGQLQQDRVARCSEAVDLQRQGLSRAEIGERMSLGAETVKTMLRDGKFYDDPTTDPARAAVAEKAATARRAGRTRSDFRSGLGLTLPKSEEAWRDAAVLHE